VQQQPNRDGVNAYGTVTSFDSIPTISQMTQQVLTNARNNQYEQEHYYDPSSIEDDFNGDNAEQLHDDEINIESTNDAAAHNNALKLGQTIFFLHNSIYYCWCYRVHVYSVAVRTTF